MFDFCKALENHSVNPARYCSHGHRNRTALRACSSSGLVHVSSLRLVFLLSSDDPGPWDPVAVKPSLRPSTFQDLVESGHSDPEGCVCSQRGDASHKTPNNLLDTSISRLGSQCLSKRLDAIFDSSHVLYGKW